MWCWRWEGVSSSGSSKRGFPPSSPSPPPLTMRGRMTGLARKGKGDEEGRGLGGARTNRDTGAPDCKQQRQQKKRRLCVCDRGGDERANERQEEATARATGTGIMEPNERSIERRNDNTIKKRMRPCRRAFVLYVLYVLFALCVVGASRRAAIAATARKDPLNPDSTNQCHEGSIDLSIDRDCMERGGWRRPQGRPGLAILKL